MSIFSDYKVGAITEDEFKNGYAFSRGDDHGERDFMDERDMYDEDELEDEDDDLEK